METFNEDPKPGRLVLPLVLIGMIATTYTFINRVAENNNLEIEPIDQIVTEEVVEEPTTEDTTTTTTTTLPDEVLSYLEEISSEKIQSIDLATKVLEANDDCDNESITYQEAKDEFADFIEDARQFVNTVAEPGPPTTFAGLVKSHEELKSLAKILKQKINTGGTVKNGEILIQGNYRDQIIDKLEKIGHRVKRVGG